MKWSVGKWFVAKWAQVRWIAGGVAPVPVPVKANFDDGGPFRKTAESRGGPRRRKYQWRVVNGESILEEYVETEVQHVEKRSADGAVIVKENRELLKENRELQRRLYEATEKSPDDLNALEVRARPLMRKTLVVDPAEQDIFDLFMMGEL